MRSIFTIAVLLFFTRSFSYGQEKSTKLNDHFLSKQVEHERELLKGGFSQKVRGKKSKDEIKRLPDFYSKIVEKAAEHNQLPSFFSKAIEREKERTTQPDFFGKPLIARKSSTLDDHFGKPIKSKEFKEQNDFFNAPSKQKDKELEADYFQHGKKGARRSEKELTMKSPQRKRWRKNFIGEKWRIFNSDPNNKKQKEAKKSNKTRDPFGRDGRKMDQPQAPKNQMDLFDGGVMPKMKDLR